MCVMSAGKQLVTRGGSSSLLLFGQPSRQTRALQAARVRAWVAAGASQALLASRAAPGEVSRLQKRKSAFGLVT